MDIIFIYGAPATGKHTVAKEIQKLTGFKLFHNHLTADLAASVFDFGTQEYSDLSTKLRLTIIDLCIKNNVRGLIFTFAYGLETFKGKGDDKFVKHLVALMDKHGKITFVKLECSKEEQLRRLTSESRKKYKKLTKINILNKIQSEFRTNKTIPYVNSLVIDNSSLSPKESAAKILAVARQIIDKSKYLK